MTVADKMQTRSINASSRTLREAISLVAFVTVASLAMMSWGSLRTFACCL
jgi:hypothetical protein